jgi:hypothetical protein
MRFLILSIVCLLGVISSGCRSVVARSGDATIKKWPQFPFHVVGREHFRLVLPAVSLAGTGTNVLHVRNLPAHLGGLFKYDICMPVKYQEDASEKDPPWNDARIIISFRKLDGVEVSHLLFHLGTSRHEPGRGWDGWCVQWPEDRLTPPLDLSYDIVVIVEQPSRRPSDRLLLGAYGVYQHKS